MKKIAFLGSKTIGINCLKYLYSKQKDLDIKIVCVLTNKRGKDIYKFCDEKSIIVIKSLDEIICRENFDIGISVQYHKILKKEHINKANELFVNLHMAPLPDYRGCNQFSFAIINGDKEFGTTIHRLEKGIDSGAIIFEKRFPIPNDCWVEELYQITFDKSVELFKESLPHLVTGNYQLKLQKSFLGKRTASLHLRKEIEEIKKIDLSWSKDKIEKHIRATYFQGFDPPYTVINNQKVNFVKGL